MIYYCINSKGQVSQLYTSQPLPQYCSTDHSLRDNGAGSGALVPPGGRENTGSLVIPSETVDTGLDETMKPLDYLAASKWLLGQLT